jgi:hypothetical protein
MERSISATMSKRPIALATVKSFGDFVIAHSVLHQVDDRDKPRTRLISCGHVKDLSAVLPQDVSVALMDYCDGEGVPALFDVRNRGSMAAIKSALSLRRGLQSIERYSGETLAFDVLGVREKFVAGRWPAIGPKKLGPNIYDTFTELLAEREIRIKGRAAPARARPGGSVGIFPESRVAEKRLTAEALSIIYERSTRAGQQATLFVLAGDPSPIRDQPWVVTIDRNFQSLANAIKSVDCVISADSLPAHLAEYFERPVFVASRFSNEYWLPHGCFVARHWGLFGSAAELSASLDRFLEQRDA